jgi:hypothetical protein
LIFRHGNRESHAKSYLARKHALIPEAPAKAFEEALGLSDDIFAPRARRREIVSLPILMKSPVSRQAELQ